MLAVFPVPGLNWLQYDGNNQTVIRSEIQIRSLQRRNEIHVSFFIRLFFNNDN